MIRILIFILALILISLVAACCEDSGDKHSAREIRKVGYSVLAVVVIIATICSSIFITDNKQTGFVNCLGINTRFDNTGGIKFKPPFISTVTKYPSTVQSLQIGYRYIVDKDSKSKTEDSDSDFETVKEESLMITKDINIIDIDADIEYIITDPVAFRYATSNPMGILINAVQIAERNNVGLTVVDDAMTTGRADLESKITDSIRNELNSHETGIQLHKYIIQDITMPTKAVQEAFSQVNDAMQSVDEKKNEAKKYENERIPIAEATANGIISGAEAKRTELINAANEEVAAFEALWLQYTNSNVVMNKLYYDAIKQIMPNMEIFISPDGKTVFVHGNYDDVQSAGNAAIQ